MFFEFKVLPRTDTFGIKEVTSDGRTVWINGPLLLARFCPVSREFCPAEDQMWTTAHPDYKPTAADWDDFVERVKSLFGIEIPARHRPLYLA